VACRLLLRSFRSASSSWGTIGPPPGPAGEILLEQQAAPQHSQRPRARKVFEALAAELQQLIALGNAQLYCLRRSLSATPGPTGGSVSLA